MHRHLHRQGKGAAIHLEAGAKRVLVSAPAAKGADKTIVYGVNHDVLTKDDLSSPTRPAPPTASRRSPRS
jgi:glyceraldehyde-3-phosphate dehydrogenase/erythrose-4-phosphate dehydrogenase